MASLPLRSRRSVRIVAAAALAIAPAVVLAAAQPAPPPGVVREGTPGADKLVGGPGADTLSGRDGGDSISGAGGPDLLNGNAGADTIDGGDGDDTMHGGRGGDVLYGGDGADEIAGDLGDDTEAGGGGADRFVAGLDTGSDVILDFSSSAGDRIVLPVGATYAVADQLGGAVISIQGGGQLRLIGVSSANLGTWTDTPAAPPQQPAPPPAAETSNGVRNILGPIILALFAAFVALAVLGLRELRRRE